MACGLICIYGLWLRLLGSESAAREVGIAVLSEICECVVYFR